MPDEWPALPSVSVHERVTGAVVRSVTFRSVTFRSTSGGGSVRVSFPRGVGRVSAITA